MATMFGAPMLLAGRFTHERGRSVVSASRGYASPGSAMNVTIMNSVNRLPGQGCGSLSTKSPGYEVKLPCAQFGLHWFNSIVADAVAADAVQDVQD